MVINKPIPIECIRNPWLGQIVTICPGTNGRVYWTEGTLLNDYWDKPSVSNSILACDFFHNFFTYHRISQPIQRQTLKCLHQLLKVPLRLSQPSRM